MNATLENATATWSHRTHNGIITIQSPTGEHRTLRIRTQKPDAKFMPGVRLVGLLTGSDNEGDYTTLGLIGDRGTLVVWKKHRGTKFETIGRMLEFQDHYESKGYTYLIEGRCRKCNRTLTTPESLASGLGPTCGGRD